MTKPIRLISRNEVIDRVPVAYGTLLGMIKRGEFPRPREVRKQMLWLESEVEEWILSRPLKIKNYKTGRAA